MGSTRSNRLRMVATVVVGVLAATGVVTSSPAGADDERRTGVGVDRTTQPQPTSTSRATRRVVFVGNNWEGTATLVGPKDFKRLGVIDVVPDYDERMQEIATNPYRLAYFLAIRELIGEGNDQLVDDMYSSNDGRLVVISRPSFADVVAISLRTRKIVWSFQVAGVRSDHMAVSPDGKRVVVSASTGNVVHVLRIADGKEVGRFASGGSPHESTFIDGGKRILHASIGTVYSPLDEPAIPDPLEGERVLQIVNAETLKIERRYNLRKALDARGLDDVSTSVRPMTLSPDETKFYFQLSFFHGFVELDRRSGKITRVVRLPNLVRSTPRATYVLDSAHHGIAANPTGTKICVAGTMSDYATLVDTRTWKYSRLIKGGLKPYWVTPSADGRDCYISWAGSDKISRISYATGTLRTSVRVGDHPQRIRNGFIRRDFLAGIGFHSSSAPRRTSAATLWERPTAR